MMQVTMVRKINIHLFIFQIIKIIIPSKKLFWISKYTHVF